VKKAIQKHSTGTLASRQDIDQATFLRLMIDAQGVVIADVSGSMRSADAGEDGDRARWDVLMDVVGQLITALGGKLVVVAYSDRPQLVFKTMPAPSGLTDMGAALRFVSPVVGGLKVVLLSDGLPNKSTTPGLSGEESALEAAGRFSAEVDVVYCGPPGGKGADFLRELAAQTGGRYEEYALTQPERLTAGILKLLTGGE